MSSDDLEIVLPNPLLSVVETGFAVLRDAASEAMAFWTSAGVTSCPLLCNRPFGEFSGNFPFVTMGKELLRFELIGGVGSVFVAARTVNAIPGRVLPADAGRSGSLVLRFGGASSGKSGRVIGWTGARARGAGELGRDEGLFVTEGRPMEGDAGLFTALPAEGERVILVVAVAAGVRRVGVDDLELGTEEFEIELVWIWGREVGVEGLELCAGLGLSPEEAGAGRVRVGVDGRVRVGVDERDGTGREVGTDVLVEDTVVERLPGVEGRELTEAELVLSTDALLLLER